MAIARQDLSLKSPWLNAAGSLGFRPPKDWSWPEPLGAFVTNPVSLARRTPAAERTLQTYSGGFLLHTGLPNPGLRAVMLAHSRRWAHTTVPVWLHVLADSREGMVRMRGMLEGHDEITALELGFPPQTSREACLALVEAASGDLPVVAALALTDAGLPWLKDLASAGASAISLTGPRGMLANKEGKTSAGRLYGPALFPMALGCIAQAQNAGLPLIVGGGVYRLEEGRALLAAGAWAVQLDAVLWKGKIP